MMAEGMNGLEYLSDVELHFPISGFDSTNRLSNESHSSSHGPLHSTDAVDYKHSIFLPCTNQLTETNEASQMTDLTNSLRRNNDASNLPSSEGGVPGLQAEKMDNFQQRNGAQLRRELLSGSIYSEDYTGGQGRSKTLEPSDVYGRVACVDGKISIQLRLINLRTNYPVNVSECWLCKNKVPESSQVYSHKHSFSGTFQVNDEYVNMIIQDTHSENFHTSNNNNTACVAKNTCPESSFNSQSASFTDVIGEFMNVAAGCSEPSSVDFTVPYANQNFSLHGKGSETENSANISQNWPQHQKNYHSSYSHPSGYNIHSAVDNIYNKGNHQGQMKAGKSSSILKGKEDKIDSPLLHYLDTYKTSSVSAAITHKEHFEPVTAIKKGETGAKKRKSKAQKKPSVIRMRGDSNSVSKEAYPSTGEVRNEAAVGKTRDASDQETIPVSADKPTSSLPPVSPNCVDLNLIQKSRKQLDSNYNLVKHIIEKTENLTCKICSMTFGRNCSDYRKHLMDVHGSTKYVFECPVCSRKFSLNKHLVQHVKIHVGVKSFKCDQCGTTYGREESLKRHLRNHNGQRPHACSICPKTFARAEYLIAHMQAHNRTKHICEKCGHVCSSRFNLVIHLMKHSKEKPFKCELCSKSFVRSDFLDNHMEVVHKKNKPKCGVCGKLFSRKDVLKRHEMMHKSVSYDCKFCLRSFSRKDRLTAHKRTHLINGELKCSKCPAAFQRKDVLVKHEKLHEEKVQCHICFKFLASEEKLLAHLSWHKKGINSEGSSNANHHICETCGKVLTRKDLLVKHIKRVHGRTVESDEPSTLKREKSFVCDICSKGFTRSCNLRSHVLKVHTVSAARRQKNTEGVSEYHEQEEDEDPDELDCFNSALNKSRHNQSNLVDLSSWTSKHKDGTLKHHSSSALLAVPNSGAATGDSWHPRPHSVSPPPSLPGNLSLPQLSSQHPHSPINLSAEAITAAAYLLAYPSYLGPYQ